MSSIVRQRTWQISDGLFNPFKLHHLETILAIGNGYMGLRGTLEEGYPGELVSTLVHGIFDHAAGELVPELVNLPNPLPVRIAVDGETFNMREGSILGYQRVLDLKTATLQRRVLWRTAQGVIVQLSFERFASLDSEHLLAQKISIRAVNQPCTITITAAIDGTQTNQGVNHWSDLKTGDAGTDRIYVTGCAGQSSYTVTVAATLRADSNLAPHPIADAKQPALRIAVNLEKTQAATFYKYSAIHTSRDATDPLDAAFETLQVAQARGWEALYAAHTNEWGAYWHDSDVEIEGDETAQRAIRFAIYHVLIATPRHDEHVSIGAKTLSGPGYKGHVFWDTELFMLPLLTVTQPRLARNLLMYRYHNLEGARHKARRLGYEGAMFPWESTDTGEETTPQWTDPQPDGTRIRIWTGDTEQHISTDIAYAIMQYWRWTGEDDFFLKYGAEIVLDTAVFWGSRVEYKPEKGRYELGMQIGPDEYHENIDNSAFTNSMVRWHLRTAIEVCEWLRQRHPAEAAGLLDRLGITEERVSRWRQITQKMYIPYDAQRGILEQFDGFFNLEPIDLAHWQPRVMNMDAILGRETTQRTRVIKQADIVMLMALQADAVVGLEARRRNWDYYFPLVDHGSSLSPSTHAWVAARLGLNAEAYKMFLYAAGMDLEDAKGNVRDGIHAAAAGGMWEAVTFGFAGLTIEDGRLTLAPNLPEHWRSVKFRVRFRGEQHTIELPAPG